MRNISPLCLFTDHAVVFLYRTITSLQEMTWIAGAETSRATDIMLLFYETVEYHKCAFNSPFKYGCVCVSVHIFFFNGPCCG